MTTTDATTGVSREWLIVCFPCRVNVGGFTEAEVKEAGYLAGVHNDLHHRSYSEAFLIPAAEYDAVPEGFEEPHRTVEHRPGCSREGAS